MYNVRLCEMVRYIPLCNKHAPLRRKVTRGVKCPWLSAGIKKLMTDMTKDECLPVVTKYIFKHGQNRETSVSKKRNTGQPKRVLENNQ